MLFFDSFACCNNACFLRWPNRESLAPCWSPLGRNEAIAELAKRSERRRRAHSALFLRGEDSKQQQRQQVAEEKGKGGALVLGQDASCAPCPASPLDLIFLPSRPVAFALLIFFFLFSILFLSSHVLACGVLVYRRVAEERGSEFDAVRFADVHKVKRSRSGCIGRRRSKKRGTRK